MTKEDKLYFAKFLRKETGCGLMTAISAINKLVFSLKHQPPITMDKPYNLNIEWIIDNN